MKRAKLLSLPCALIISVAMLLLQTGVSSAATQKAACGAWTDVSSPNAGTFNELHSVAPISANDVWAVGSYGNSGGPAQTLTEHWNGSAWSIVSSPNAGSGSNGLAQASKVPNTNQVWAVGSYDSGSVQNTLVEHWDGSTWSIVSSPNPSSTANALSGVVSISTNNVWAVGEEYDDNTGAYNTLIEHWNGSTWSVVPSPNISSFSDYLNGIADFSANNIWTVGEYTSFNSDTNQTLIEHWNGHKWKIISSANGSSNDNNLYAVITTAANNVWTVGSYVDNSGNAQTLTERWNGSSWAIVSSPNLSTTNNVLDGLTAVSASDIWSVGLYTNSSSLDQALIEQWNGTQWNILSGANIGPGVSYLDSVARLPHTSNLWTVGSASNNTLTEYYC